MRLLLLALLALGAAEARAHSKEPERRLILQRDGKGVALLWHVSLLGGPAELLFAAQDRDRDGVLSDEEGKRLAAVLLAKASRGAEIRCDGTALPVTGLEAHPADAAARRNIVVLALATLGTSGCGGEGVEHLEVRLSSGTAPLALEVQVRDGWQLAEPSMGRLAADGAGLEGAVRLGGGEALLVQARRGEAR